MIRLPEALRDDERGSFALKGSALLDQEHRLLSETVAAFPAARLHSFPDGGKVRFVSLIHGVAMHDVYHAGQIQLLRRLND
jgi:hypothetical protein